MPPTPEEEQSGSTHNVEPLEELDSLTLSSDPGQMTALRPEFSVYIHELPLPDVWYIDEDEVNLDQSAELEWGSPRRQSPNSGRGQPSIVTWVTESRQVTTQHRIGEGTDTNHDMGQQRDVHSRRVYHRSRALSLVLPSIRELSQPVMSQSGVLTLLQDRLHSVLQASPVLQRVYGRRGGSDVYRREAMLISNIRHLASAIAEQQEFEAAFDLALDLETYELQRRVLSLRDLIVVMDHRLGNVVDVSSFSLSRGDANDRSDSTPLIVGSTIPPSRTRDL